MESSLEDRYYNIVKNLSDPIDYQNQSVAGIRINQNIETPSKLNLQGIEVYDSYHHENKIGLPFSFILSEGIKIIVIAETLESEEVAKLKIEEDKLKQQKIESFAEFRSDAVKLGEENLKENEKKSELDKLIQELKEKVSRIEERRSQIEERRSQIELEILNKEKKVSSIIVDDPYKGFLDFGSDIGKKRIGDSFSSQFNLNAVNIQKDPKTQDFIRSTFNHFEKSNKNCFAFDECRTYFINQGFVVALPKMGLIFSTDKRRTLLSIILKDVEQREEGVSNQINYHNRSYDGEKVEEGMLVISPVAPLALSFGDTEYKIKHSFSDMMDLTRLKPENTPNVKNFIVSLYNEGEKTDINCLEEKKCHIENQETHIVFKLPKAWLNFTKNNLAVLESVTIISEKSEKLLNNRRVPFHYGEGSIGNINVQMNKEEVEKQLNGSDFISYGESIMAGYNEGLLIDWTKNNDIFQIQALSKEASKEIYSDLNFYYEGIFNFGPEIGNKQLGDSLVEEFDLNQMDPKKDQKAIDFIVSLYKNWENSDINCLEEKDCEIIVDNEGFIEFDLPKAKLQISNDFQRSFRSITLKSIEFQKKEEGLKNNVEQPINILDMSLGNINFDMTREEIEKILNFTDTYLVGPGISEKTYLYKEGLSITYDESDKPVSAAASLNFLDISENINLYKGGLYLESLSKVFIFRGRFLV